MLQMMGLAAINAVFALLVYKGMSSDKLRPATLGALSCVATISVVGASYVVLSLTLGASEPQSSIRAGLLIGGVGLAVGLIVFLRVRRPRQDTLAA